MDNRSWKDEILDNTQEVDQEKMQGDIAILRKLNMLIEVRAFENPDLSRRFMSVMGRKGGSYRNPRKGFASMSTERRRAISARANAVRWGPSSGKEIRP
jgi:hypothetical protein